jgi:ABC-type Na+ efflux pump permease subunit
MLVGAMLVAAIVMAFIPILGQLNSLHTLVLGGIALVFVLSIFESLNPGSVPDRVDFVPGFWFFVGLLAISGVTSWLAMMIIGLVASSFETVEEGIGQMMMFPLGAIFGFLPVFMYGSWLGAQVRGGF